MRQDESGINKKNIWSRMWRIHIYLAVALVMAILLVTYSIPDIIRHGITSDLFGHLFTLYLLLFSLSKWLDAIGRKKLGNVLVYISLIPGIGAIVSKFVLGVHTGNIITLTVIIIVFIGLMFLGGAFVRNSSRGQ